MTTFQIVAALVMLGAAIGLVAGYRKYLKAGSERRMIRMLECAGLDPSIAASGDHAAVIREIRARCRTCSSESVCEMWLASHASGDNSFCPNARVFDELARTASASH